MEKKTNPKRNTGFLHDLRAGVLGATMGMALASGGCTVSHVTSRSGAPTLESEIVQGSRLSMLNEISASDLLRDGDPRMFLFQNWIGDRLTVPLSHYLSYKQRSHRIRSNQDLVQFVTPHDPYIQELTASLLLRYPYANDRERGFVITSFLPSLAVYINDPNNSHQDYVKYPIETLVEQSGDCEDLTILAASLLLAAGQDVILLNYEGPLQIGEDGESWVRIDHINLAVAGDYYGSHVEVDGRRYYIIEPTSRTLRIGYMPRDLENRRTGIIRP